MSRFNNNNEIWIHLFAECLVKGRQCMYQEWIQVCERRGHAREARAKFLRSRPLTLDHTP